MFLYLAWRVRKITEGREADAARRLFGFSILYLFLLFAVMLVEHLARAVYSRSQRWRSS